MVCGRGDIDADIVGGPQVEAMFFVDIDLVADLGDLDIREKVLVGLDLDRGVFALGDKDLCRTTDLDVLEVVYLAVFCPDITIAMNPFAHESLAGSEKQGDSEEPGETGCSRMGVSHHCLF
jgi:hypothetical protein